MRYIFPSKEGPILSQHDFGRSDGSGCEPEGHFIRAIKKGLAALFLFTTGKKVLLVVDVHRDFETEADVAVARGIPFHDTHLRLVGLISRSLIPVSL